MADGSLEIATPRVFLPLLKPARYKGAHGGRGSGKSHALAEMLVERCLLNPGTRWACVREVQKSLEHSVKRLIDDKIAAFGVSHLFRSLNTHIETPGGGVIIFAGMQSHTADSIKSLEGFDGCWVEEAQSLSQYSLDLLRPTIRKEGSELWFSWNPEQASDPIDQLLRGPRPPDDAVVVEANYRDNPFLPEVLRLEMESDRARDPDRYAWVWLGQYRQISEARVFRNWTVQEFDVPDGVTLRQGADWGFSVDPSVLVQCYSVGRKLYVPHEAYMVGCEIDNLPALFDTVPQSRKWWTVADSARPETVSYMRRHWSERIGAAVKGKGSVEDGVEFLKSFDIVVHPRCTHTIDELTTYAYEIDDKTGKVLPKLADKNNHVIDALRYGVEGVRRAESAAPQSFTMPAVQSHWSRYRA